MTSETFDSEAGSDVEEGLEAPELDVTADQKEPLDLPLEERRLITQPYDFSVQTLVDMAGTDKLVLSPVYQRRYVWDEAKASRLIESLLLNIPIPVCYFAENADATLEVIDGQQRLQSIKRFTADELRLRGLPVQTEMEGKVFSDLSVRDQRRILNRTIRCIVITEESHPDIKFDVFERLNAGAVMLSAQELRNSIYRGTFNDELARLGATEEFLRIFGRTPDSAGKRNSRMEEEELVLRFIALADPAVTYRAPLRQFLNIYMRSHRNDTPPRELAALLLNTAQTVYDVFGAEAFYVPRKDRITGRNINKALYDAVMLSLARADRVAVLANVEKVRQLRADLLSDPSFEEMIGRATADRTRMQGRVGMFLNGLAEIGITCESLDI